MRFVEFKQLSMPMQARLICRQGIFLAERIEDDYVIALYALMDFYVEVHHRAADSEVAMIGSFYHVGLLEPYLAHVDIGGLLQAVVYQSERRANNAE